MLSKIKILTFLPLFFLIIQLGFSQKKQKNISSGQKAYLLVDVLKKNHCQPRTIDNGFSQELFDLFLKKLDPQKTIFTVGDLTQISSFKTQLDDQIKAKDLVFLKKMNQIYTKRLAKLDTLIKINTALPVDFYSHEIYQPNKKELALTETQWEENWHSDIKYQILSIVFNSLSMEKHTNKKITFNDKTLLHKKELIARKRVRDNNLRHVKEDFGTNPNELDLILTTVFLQSIANLYDQHTDYYGISDATEYLNATNPEKEIFGFRFGENKSGEIEISNLIPGSPAWKSGQLTNGDIMVAVQWEGEEIIDIIGADEVEINDLLTLHDKKALSLMVRKASQEIKTVTLSRAPVIQIDESVTSYILENKAKFGYINLPSFYNNFEDQNTISCANDVAREIEKLKQDNIKGLVLDLRYNGGGSLTEAIELAGLFIDQGVFGAYKDNSTKNIIVSDPIRGSIYDGPLIVLVNQMSASASEILAGILQDYNRAVIVGSKTFGKGVAQTIFPLDSTINKPKDFAKATIFRIFRPSGKPIQSIGIMPDVILPFILDSIKIGEIHEGIYLNASTLTKNISLSPLQPLPLKTLVINSNQRINSDSSMAAVKKISGKLKEMEINADHKISLYWGVFQREYKKNRQSIDNLMNKTYLQKPSFVVLPNPQTLKNQLPDVDNIDYSLQAFQTLRKDIYINEALNILLDLNTLQKKM